MHSNYCRVFIITSILIALVLACEEKQPQIPNQYQANDLGLNLDQEMVNDDEQRLIDMSNLEDIADLNHISPHPTTCSLLSELVITWHPELGTPALIQGVALNRLVSECSQGEQAGQDSSTSPKRRAEDLINHVAKLYRASDDLRFDKLIEAEDGSKQVRFKQMIGVANQEIPIIGSRLTVHFNIDEEIHTISGYYWPLPQEIDQTSLTTADALRMAQTYALEQGFNLEPSQESENIILSFYPNEGRLLLGYDLSLSEGEFGRKWRFFVESVTRKVTLIESLTPTGGPEGPGEIVELEGAVLANDGGHIVTFDGWYSYMDEAYFLYHHQRQWSVWEINESCNMLSDMLRYSSTNWANEDPAAISAAYHLDLSLQFLEERYQYQGWDGEGGASYAIIRYPCHQPNAFYLGNGIFAFGGSGEIGGDFSILDVVSHELIHALTATQSGLIYSGESGAINESFSDIFAVLISRHHTSILDWVIAENTIVSRDLSQPLPQRPNTYEGEAWVDPTSPIDFGGVHTNSSVQSYFFYLLLLGDEEREGIIFSDAEELTFRTLTRYASPTSDYPFIRLAWLAAAQEIDEERGVDLNNSLREKVDAAWRLVGVSPPDCVASFYDQDQDGRGDPNRPAELCTPPVGYVLNTDDCDDLNPLRYRGAEELCGDGIINDCSLSVEEACGPLNIERGDDAVTISWQSECILQASSDLTTWVDEDQATTRTNCSAESLVSTDEQAMYYRLRLP